ncbi:hypothetical protein [Devosia sp.]|uniref:hypothetical protein n=1 Tax=Devosia sp. TaxID=1871048 RepID=UPI001B146EEC|nr:hypothetical protein [Devosia sp.]MBO9589073.1 hypothetical protein [Devosia sp.]
MKELIAAKSMTYATRRLSAGDLFTASNRDARILTALKRARHAEAVAIPETWETLPWPQLRSLASEFSDAPIKNKAEAIAAIQAEIAKRGAAA